MDWNALAEWLSGPGLWPFWVGLILCVCVISLVIFIIWAICYGIISSFKQEKEDKQNMEILVQRGYKKDVIEDFLEIYNVSLKHIVKYKTIENELKNFSTGKVVSLPGKTKDKDDGSGAAAGLAAGMIIGSMHH